MMLYKGQAFRLYLAQVFNTSIMPNKRIKQLILDLPFEQKIIGAGAFLMFISLFMPWYQDIDMFKTGDMFLGVTGPLYFAGYTILLITILDIALLVTGAMDIKLPVNVRSSTIYLASGIIFFYLLFFANSVYFHQKFGLNLLNKESPFGMFFAFISASLVTIGGYISTRDKQALLKEFQEQTREPMIKLNEQVELRKPKENLRTLNTQTANQNIPQTAQVSLEEVAAVPKKIVREPVKLSAENAFGNAIARQSAVNQANIRMARQTAQPLAQQAESDQPAEQALPKKQPQPYRFDL